MYGAMLVTAARVLLGYALVAPLVLGGLVALLLGTNIAASYWFQRQRQRQNTSKHHAFSTIHAAAPRVVQKAWALAVDPPVPRIPRLQFASLLPRTIESSLFPTDFNARNVAATSGSNSNGDLLPMLALLFPLATHELLALLRLAVRDFVESWFGDISADPSFPRCVLYQMAQTVDAVVERAVERVDAAEVLVGQVLPIVTAHIHAVKECESACLDQDGGEHGADGANGLGGDEGVGRRISEMYAKSGSMRWHPALKGLEDIGGGGDQDRGDDERKRRVMAHVRKVVNLLVPLVLPPEQSSFAPHRVLVREMLTGALFAPIVLAMADPDTLNQLLDTQLGRLIREQHMVTELRDALDQQARTGDTGEGGVSPANVFKGSGDTILKQQQHDDNSDDDQDDEHYSPPVRSYEEFMTMIDECQSPASLQRIHEDILAQIRKRRILIMGQNKDDIVHGHKVRDVLVYINRLYVAKKKAERRLEMLVRDQALLSDSNNRGGGGYLARGPRGSVSSLPEQQQHIRPIANASTVLSARTFSAGSDAAPTAHIPSRLLSKKQQQQAAVPRRQPLLKPSPMSRTSTYYQHRDDPAKLGPPQFTQREILTNVSSLSAFAEYMDVIGHKFILEFWLNVEGVRQSSSNNSDNNSGGGGGLSGRPSRAIFPSIVRTLWKSYFTLRVDELASLSVRGYEVEAAISRVQRLLKPYRVVSAETVDLDVARLDDSVCVEAFELICLVQNAVFRHMETSILPPFVRSAFYSQFLKEYYVTPRQDLIEAALFEPVTINEPVLEEEEGEDEDEGSRVLGTEVSNNSTPVAVVVVTGDDDGGAKVLRRRHRRVSVASSNSGSAPRKGSLSRRWNFSARTRHHHDEPVVGTSTRAVLASELSGSRTSISGMAVADSENNMDDYYSQGLSATPMVVQAGIEGQVDNTKTTTTTMTNDGTAAAVGVVVPRRVVGRSEVRRLSASLRSIALGDGDQDPEVPVGPPSPVAEEVEDSQAASIPVSETNHDDIDDDDGDIGDNDDIDDNDDGSDNEDEAESLVLARVIKTPTPGDLFLDERLLNLTHDLERKAHQMAIVRALMRQAQSRHRAHEQRVLRASFKGLRREVHAEMEQQRQYECVLADHTIAPGRTRVHIPRAVASPAPAKASAAAGDGDHARDAAGSHVVYLIELQQSLPPEYTHNYNNNTISGSAMMTATTPTTGWVVARRYREFFAMHQKLKQTHPDAMRLHELPARTPLIRLQKDRDIEHRRLGLEKYLQGVLREAQVCNTRAVRLFLSSCEPPSGTLPVSGSLGKSNEGAGGGWMEQIFKTVGEDIEGITGADSMLEIIVQELGAQVAMQHSESTSQAAAAADSSAAFIDPLSDVFIEVFGLKNRRNWLRRQAISILLRHIVGGTVERRIRLMLTSFVTSDPQLSQLLCQLRTSMWPDNQKFRAPAKRSAEQRSECRARARRQILGYVPRVLGNMVGRKNAQEGARLVFDAMQYDCVGLNLALSVFDAVVSAVFPEIKFQLE